MAKDLNRPVYALDLRNHGSSPHAAPHTYPALAADVRHFLTVQRFSDVQLLGHSMGGKVAMAAALDEAGSDSAVVEKLIVADIAPNRGRISEEFTNYVKAMKDVSERGVKSRKEAMEGMRQVEQVCLLLWSIYVT